MIIDILLQYWLQIQGFFMQPFLLYSFLKYSFSHFPLPCQPTQLTDPLLAKNSGKLVQYLLYHHFNTLILNIYVLYTNDLEKVTKSLGLLLFHNTVKASNTNHVSM